MAHLPINRVISHIRSRLGEPAGGPSADGILLRQFAEQDDETAFAQLMDRHGGLVWGVCQRVLGHAQDAEDAFQATFLVLARKAAAIAKKDSVRSWLHGVAYRIARNVKRAAAVRRDREGRSEPRQPGNDSEELTWKEVRQVLDEELSRLPEKYRLPLLLCFLEGKTQDEAARQLGWGRDVFRGRLDRGRERLHRRLSKRGIGLSAALSASLVAQGVSRAAVPAALRTATIQAATLSASRTISAPVSALVEGVLRTMFLTKIKLAAGLLLSLAVLAVGAGLAAQQAGILRTDEAPQAEGVQVPEPPRANAEGPKGRLDRYGDLLPPGASARLGTVRFRHGDGVFAVAFSPDGKMLASASHDETVRLWDAATGKEIRQLHGHEGYPMSVTFSPDGQTLATGGNDCMVRLWDTATGKLIRQLEREDARILAVTFAPDGKMFASVSDKAIRLWDTATGKEIRQLETCKPNVAPSVAFSPDGKTMASSTSNVIRLWDVATGKEIRQLQGLQGSASQLAFSPDSRTLASAEFGSICLWEVASGKKIHRLPGGSAPLAFSPDGKTLASARARPNGVAGFCTDVVCLWDTATGKEIRWLEVDRGLYISAVAFSPDGKTLASASDGMRIRLWEVATGKVRRRSEGHGNAVTSVAFSPDGKTLASGSWDHTVRLWDVAASKEIRQIDWQQGWPVAVAFAPDGKTLATGSDDQTVRLWESATGKEIRRFQGNQGRVSSVAFAPDGKTLASGGSDATILVWDVVPFDRSRQPGELTDKDLPKLWTALASDDVGTAYQAIADLAAGPKQAVPYLQERLHPVPTPEPRRLARLLADLDSNQFAVRQQAAAELEKIGAPAAPALRKLLDGQPSLEAKRRVKQVLEKLEALPHTLSPKQLRELRSIQVLERAGTAEAKQLLETLAKGTPEARLTREAKASLDRLSKRPNGN